MEQIKITGKYTTCICTFYNNGKANIMMVDSVEVNPKYRGKGVGTALMDYIIQLGKEKKVDSIELNVNKDNIVAKHLYEKVGFKKTNKDYYRIIL